MPLASHPSNSTIRRKPQYTYKSPSAQDWGPVLPRTSTIQSAQSRITASSSARIPMKNSASSSYVSKPIKRKNNGILPALPLYHPMGTLALSLPPLDPASFGLPSPVTSDDNHAAHGPSSHIRSPANHPGHEQDDTLTVGTIAAVATQETTEKATPRKRRSAGGSKRKRKDVDDGDPTYPTRRTRLPRSVIHQAESEEPSEEAVAVGTEQGDDIFDEKKPERRSTRSRGNPSHCDSSFSDGGPGTLPLGVEESAVATPFTATVSDAPTEVKVQTPAPRPLPKNGDRATMDEKEDGELSEGHIDE